MAGSPSDWAASGPTISPGCTLACWKRVSISQPVERLLGQLVLLGDALGVEIGAEEDFHEQRCVRLRHFAQPILARHHDQVVGQATHTLDDLDRVEIGRLAQVNAERLLSVHDQADDVAVDHLALDRVALLKFKVARLGMIAHVDTVAVVHDNGCGTVRLRLRLRSSDRARTKAGVQAGKPALRLAQFV